jgi:hypothetical protein
MPNCTVKTSPDSLAISAKRRYRSDTDGFDKLAYPHYGGFITIPHHDTTPNSHDFIIMHFENNACPSSWYHAKLTRFYNHAL